MNGVWAKVVDKEGVQEVSAAVPWDEGYIALFPGILGIISFFVPLLLLLVAGRVL